MAMKMYEFRLKERFIPAENEDTAKELLGDGDVLVKYYDNLETKKVVEEDDTMKLFILAKTMMDLDRYNCEEIAVAVSALATRLGYSDAPEIAESVITWTERFVDVTLFDLQEWLLG